MSFKYQNLLVGKYSLFLSTIKNTKISKFHKKFAKQNTGNELQMTLCSETLAPWELDFALHSTSASTVTLWTPITLYPRQSTIPAPSL